MTARKLSDSEKQDILQLYRTTGETSSTLATRYGVSTSTVSRLLKSTLPVDEYEALIQQKRSLRGADSSPEIAEQVIEPEVTKPEVTKPEASIEPFTLPLIESTPELESEPESEPESTSVAPPAPELTVPTRAKPILRHARQANAETLANNGGKQLEVPLANLDTAQPAHVEPGFEEGEVLKEILSQNLVEPEDDLVDDLEDDLDDDLDDDDDDFDGDEGDGGQPLLVSGRLKDGFTVQILPLAEAPIPRTCYLVVDRAAELVAPPLRDFGDLGQIPEAEIQAKTLPIFDNHRIAKRYSNPRTQRVIKLPDGKILSKTSSHLRAKGITRLLIDGRVYALS